MNSIDISNKTRDMVSEAQAAGSTATTRKGAIKYLLAHRPVRDHERFQPLREYDGGVRRSGWNVETSWKNAVQARKSNPAAKRARDDKNYRQKFLAACRREEKRLVKNPTPSADAAYNRLAEIAKQRAIATSRPVARIPSRKWMTDYEARQVAVTIAHCAGLANDGFDSGRGDHHEIHVIDIIYGDGLALYNGLPPVLAVVEHARKRVYAKSSAWFPGYRSDRYLIGQNDSGTAFAHQVSHNVVTVAGAHNWIWSGAVIIARQGDVGVAPSHLKNVTGDDCDIPIGGGHSRHRFVGECYDNGSLHVRSGFLIHTAGQHPPIYLDGSCWRRIVIARRSERGMSTSD